MRKHYPKNLTEKWQKFWDKEKIFRFVSKSNKPIFSIDTPPPTMSGKMHLGHFFSYTHQDIIARYHRQKGENVFYPFGIDDAGLPTERFIEQEIGIKATEIKREDFNKLCQEFLRKFEPKFIKKWQKIGLSCDFSLFYFTISPQSQKISQHFFLDLYKKKRIYQKQAPMLWCPFCQTAIAQAELEDKKTETYFNDIYFQLNASSEKIVISTTRPELLPACVAVFVHPKDKRYKKLIGKEVVAPIFKQKVSIRTDEKVDMKKGTGIVMCCTFGDTADIEWYLSHSLPLRISINRDGTMNELAQKYQGLKIKEARQAILEDLKKQNLLVKQTKIFHMVNVHERCGTEIEILETKQWFLRYLDLKNDFIETGRKIKWLPEYIRHRYENWVKGLQWDWCISRQRYFGVPFPVWYCENCGKVILAGDSVLPVNPLTSQPKIKCDCGSKKFIPEKDVFDTWFTSSLTPILIGNKKLQPMSLRPQAHDIINTWLFYTIVRAKIHFNKIPWQTIMISGFVLDPKGKKMSKSKGNIIEPKNVLEKFPLDALRYWAGSASLGKNLRYQEKEILKGHKLMTKLWNAVRFSFSHLKPEPVFKVGSCTPLDKWILAKLQKTIKISSDFLDNYEFAKAKQEIERFFWQDFCDNYLELVKYRLYSKENTPAKKSAQLTLYQCLFFILKLFAPFIPCLCEEIYQMGFRKQEKVKSIHLCSWPKPKKALENKEMELAGNELIDIIAEIRKAKSVKGYSMKKEIKKVVIFAPEVMLKEISLFSVDLKQSLNINCLEFEKNGSKSDKYKLKILF